MSQREKFDDERRGAESYFQECGVIASWLHDGRLLFSDEADASVAAAERKGMGLALEIAEDFENAGNCDGSCATSIRADALARDAR